MAINSIQFMEMLISIKNSADVKTYTQSANTVDDGYRERDDTKDKGFGWTEAFSSWPRILKQRLTNSIRDEDVSNANDKSVVHCSTLQTNSAWNIKNSCPKHETVAEYIGRLWFLNKSGIKFRETIKVVAISPDGKSSSVECHTEYHNGEKWISCSKIICEFTSNVQQEGSLKLDGGLGVKMTLDCELLIWLPLPHAAKTGVKNKISSVFETVAVDFFNEYTR